MNKRGIAWWFLIELLAGVFAAALIIHAANLWASSEIFFETKLVRDIGLMVDSIHTPQSNFFLAYPTNLSKYVIDIKKNELEIYNEGDVIKPSSFFVTKENELAEQKFKDKSSFEFSKSAGRLVIGQEVNIKKLTCPGSRQAIDSMKFLLDPGIGVSPVATALKESEINRLIALDLARKLRIKDSTRNLDVDEPRPIDWLAKIKPDTSVILSFHLGRYTYSGNIVKAYVVDNDKKEQSIGLACNILNSLLQRFDDVSFVLLSKGQLNYLDDRMQILNNDKVAVMLEIGNVLNPGTLDNLPEISSLIYSGMGNYYVG